MDRQKPQLADAPLRTHQNVSERVGAMDHQEQAAGPEQGERGLHPGVEPALGDMGARPGRVRRDARGLAVEEGRVGDHEIERAVGEARGKRTGYLWGSVLLLVGAAATLATVRVGIPDWEGTPVNLLFPQTKALERLLTIAPAATALVR